jgi:hypothetical protein
LSDNWQVSHLSSDIRFSCRLPNAILLPWRVNQSRQGSNCFQHSRISRNDAIPGLAAQGYCSLDTSFQQSFSTYGSTDRHDTNGVAD